LTWYLCVLFALFVPFKREETPVICRLKKSFQENKRAGTFIQKLYYLSLAFSNLRRNCHCLCRNLYHNHYSRHPELIADFSTQHYETLASSKLPKPASS